MYQKIGSVQTNTPLWILQQSMNARTAVLAGEGLWRWRMYQYSQNKKYDAVDDFVLKTAQFLSIKQDNRPFKVQISKSIFSDYESIVFDAELYNTNLELVNTPDVNLVISNDQGIQTKHTMNRENGSYSLNIGSLAAGNYSYSANVNLNGKNYNASGNFVVLEDNIELSNTTADFGLLKQLAEDHNGEFLLSSSISQHP
jgi:hypothetical protein